MKSMAFKLLCADRIGEADKYILQILAAPKM
jgi:hypothetical protein